MTLVVFVAERASRDAVGAIDERILHELGRIIRHAVRDTDLLGRTVDGMLSLMLAGIDVERATAVIERVNDHLGHYRMLFELSVGAACCPTHAIRVDELLRHAIARSRRTPRRGNGPPTF
jgi:GGDEF domain-containing protein